MDSAATTPNFAATTPNSAATTHHAAAASYSAAIPRGFAGPSRFLVTPGQRGAWPARQPRTPHRVPCRVQAVDAGTGEVRTMMGETVNLSREGVALHVGVEVPVGTWVETLVPRPDGSPLFLCGTVVRVRRTLAANFEIGVELRARQTPDA
jgi:hypothetical protein